MTDQPSPAPRPRAALRAVTLSAVFPSASQASRTALGAALAGLTVLLIVLASLRWQAPLIGLVGLGLPLLFMLHLDDVGVRGRDAAVVTVLGTVFGIGWALGDDAAIASVGPDALGTPVSATRLLTTSVAFPLTFLALLLLIVRIVRPCRRNGQNPLHGCLIGTLGGYSLAAASTLTELASQFDDGLMADDTRTATTLAAAAIVQGLAVPLTAAGVGGAFGATLWCAQPRNAVRRCVRLRAPGVSIAGGVAAYVARGLLDLTPWSSGVHLALHLTIAALALGMQRLVLRSALQPTPLTGADGDPAGREPARTVAIAGVGAALVMASAAALSLWVSAPAPKYVCPPNCGRPPLRQPVATNPRFTPADGEFSVSYPGEGTAYTAEFQPHGVVLTLLADEGGTLRLYGEPAAGRSARQVVSDVIADAEPDARIHYEIPNALVGYRLGFGVVADVYPKTSIGADSRMRVLVMAAVKDDYALIAAGAGRFREFGPDFGSGHPSGANFLLALDMGKYVNSFRWRGDPPR